MNNFDKLAGKFLEYLNGAGAFLHHQMPDFVNQFITYETWKVGWEFKIALAILIVLVLLQLIIIVTALRGEDGEAIIWMIFLIGIAGTASLFITVSSYESLQMIHLAPKVYMVHQAKEIFVNKKSCD